MELLLEKAQNNEACFMASCHRIMEQNNDKTGESWLEFHRVEKYKEGNAAINLRCTAHADSGV